MPQKKNPPFLHFYVAHPTATAIAFLVDGSLYNTVQNTAIPPGTQWVFNNPFFILLNVAVGGNFAGSPDSTTVFPQDMLVDYVRVYQPAPSGVASIEATGVQNSASFSDTIAPGGLATIYGSGFSQVTADSAFDPDAGVFPGSYQAVSVLVNGLAAPLTYVSPTQINFQVPYESIRQQPVRIEVSQNGILSNAIPTTLTDAAPSAFADSSGVAILNWFGGPICTAGGSDCTLWGNGFGPTNIPQTDGALATAGTTMNPCVLTIGGVAAPVDYCGTAPDQIINQLNFRYPKGIAASGATATATLRIGDAAGTFLLPALF